MSFSFNQAKVAEHWGPSALDPLCNGMFVWDVMPKSLTCFKCSKHKMTDCPRPNGPGTGIQLVRVEWRGEPNHPAVRVTVTTLIGSLGTAHPDWGR
jgi:hypothetical protein